MKFITLCDYTGLIECEIFAQAYRRFGLVAVRHAVVEVEAGATPQLDSMLIRMRLELAVTLLHGLAG